MEETDYLYERDGKWYFKVWGREFGPFLEKAIAVHALSRIFSEPTNGRSTIQSPNDGYLGPFN